MQTDENITVDRIELLDSLSAAIQALDTSRTLTDATWNEFFMYEKADPGKYQAEYKYLTTLEMLAHNHVVTAHETLLKLYHRLGGDDE